MRGHAARRMFAAGGAVCGVVALWGAMAWSRPGPHPADARMPRGTASGGSGPVRDDAQAVRRVVIRPGGKDGIDTWVVTPAAALRPAHVVRISPPHGVPHVSTGAS